MKQKCYLYHICRESDKWNFNEGYIGISRKPSKRWKAGYGKQQPHIRAALKKYSDIVKYVVIWGSEDKIKQLENKLRPRENMAWNIAKGGGSAPSPKGRAHCVGNLPRDKYSRKGTKHTEASRLKMSISQRKVSKKNSERMTANNPMSGMSEENHPSFKGWYHTPAGKYGSACAAAKGNNVSPLTVHRRVAEGSVVLRARCVPKEWSGKYWKECGWWFEPKGD